MNRQFIRLSIFGGVPLGVIHTLSGSAQPRGARARDLVPPPFPQFRVARVRKLTRADLNPAVAVKNLLDMQIVDRSALSSIACQQGKCFSLLHCLPYTSPPPSAFASYPPPGAPWIDCFLSDSVFMCVYPSFVLPGLFSCPFEGPMSYSQCLHAPPPPTYYDTTHPPQPPHAIHSSALESHASIIPPARLSLILFPTPAPRFILSSLWRSPILLSRP